MIRILVTPVATNTVRDFLRGRGRKLRRTLRFATYDDATARRPGSHTYVFADLERLDDDARTRAARFYASLDPARRRTDPASALMRPDLLPRLHADGINRFTVSRVGTAPTRWPVFLRGSDDHEGNASPLLPDAQALADAVAKLARPEAMLQVEYVETLGTDGLYRKYGAFRIGDRIVPRHVFFGPTWMLKEADHVDDATIEEELAYVRTNPHAEQLLDVFDRAGIEYGRIDYGFAGDALQVWEINTNPMIMSNRSFTHAPRGVVHEAVLPQLEEAFRDLAPRRSWFA
ncbi:MAG: hypothetical protein AAGD14_18060 [Planctomycetota bacterium]